jgi:hypothetical protein
MDSITGAMTAEERAVVESWRASNLRLARGCLFWALVPIPLLFATCGGCASLALRQGRAGASAGAMALFGLVLGVLMLRSQRRSQREFVALLDAALADGHVEETRYRAKGASVLHEPHSCAFIQIETDGEPRLLHLCGPYIDPLLAKGAFPTRELKVVRMATAGEVITVVPEGEPIAPQPTNYVERHDEGLEMMPDGTVFPGRLETLDQDFRVWLAQPN